MPNNEKVGLYFDKLRQAPSLARTFGSQVRKTKSASFTGIFAAILEAVWFVLRNLSVAEIRENRKAITEAALQMYDVYLAPIDLPAIPNTFEAKVDDAIRKGLAYMLDHVFDLIAGEDVDPQQKPKSVASAPAVRLADVAPKSEKDETHETPKQPANKK